MFVKMDKYVAVHLILLAASVSARPGDPDDLLATVERNVSAASVSTNTAGNGDRERIPYEVDGLDVDWRQAFA